MRPLRVAWVGHRSPILGGGMATYSRETVRGLRDRGVSVVFFHHRDERGADEEAVAEETVPLTSVKIRKPLVYSPPAARRALEEGLRKRKVDLVHASYWFSSLDFELPRICRELGLPLVVTFHVAFDRRLTVWGGLSQATYRVYARALKACRRVIVFGQAQAGVLEDLGVPGSVLTVLPNGVDIDKYAPAPSDARRWFGAERLFVYLGRVDSEKNVDVLVRAFLDCSPPPKARLVVVGTGTERRRLRRAFDDPRVVFTGHESDEKRRIAILQAADGFFLPSTVEGLSLSLLEAMACGTPTVATDVGADGEALRGAGLVLDPLHLEEELRLAFRMLLDVPELGRMLGAAARARVEERYALAANLDRLVDLYQEVAS